MRSRWRPCRDHHSKCESDCSLCLSRALMLWGQLVQATGSDFPTFDDLLGTATRLSVPSVVGLITVRGCKHSCMTHASVRRAWNDRRQPRGACSTFVLFDFALKLCVPL